MKLFVPPCLQPQQSLYPLPVPASAASFMSPEGEARVSLIFFLVVNAVMLYKCACKGKEGKEKKCKKGGSILPLLSDFVRIDENKTNLGSQRELARKSCQHQVFIHLYGFGRTAAQGAVRRKRNVTVCLKATGRMSSGK